MFVEYFYNPEKLLRTRQAQNPFYPFTAIEPNVYAVFDTPKWYIAACIICAVILAATVVVCATTRHVSEFVIIPILTLLYFAPQMIAIRGPRTLLVDFNENSYEVNTGTSR